MVSDIDQFGRDTSKNDISSLNEGKSKKILDSLAEIKDQLENKNYNPNVEESIPKTKVSSTKNNSNYEELKLKIESIMKRGNLNRVKIRLSANKKIKLGRFDKIHSVLRKIKNVQIKLHTTQG